MNQVVDFFAPFQASPSFSPDSSFQFPSLKTDSAIFRADHSVFVGDTATEPAVKFGRVAQVHEPVAEQLFSATADAKIWTSKVAMHLDRAVRDRLFKQLDILHDSDEWVADGAPVNLDSYKSCVRAILHHNIDSRPSLALMPSGNVLALWRDGQDKLSVEFLPANATRWMVQSISAAGQERAAGTAPLERLRDVLQPYCADRWFNAG